MLFFSYKSHDLLALVESIHFSFQLNSKMTLKGTVCKKKTIFTHPHVVPKLYAILYSNKHKKMFLIK